MDFLNEAKILYSQLEQHGYPRWILNTTLNCAKEVPRSTLSLSKIKQRDERISWAIDYTPRSNQIRRVILRHWHLLKEIPGCELPPQIGLCRTRNLRNALIRSDVSERLQENNDSLPKGHFKCGHCKICQTVMEDCVIRMCDRDFRIKYSSFSTCTTEGLVYLLKCTCDPPLFMWGNL